MPSRRRDPARAVHDDVISGEPSFGNGRRSSTPATTKVEGPIPELVRQSCQEFGEAACNNDRFVAADDGNLADLPPSVIETNGVRMSPQQVVGEDEVFVVRGIGLSDRLGGASPPPVSKDEASSEDPSSRLPCHSIQKNTSPPRRSAAHGRAVRNLEASYPTAPGVARPLAQETAFATHELFVVSHSLISLK